jgi:serine/threonine protein kinase
MIRRELSRFFLSGVKWTGRPSLGVGAYGSVEPLELNGMMCAGKKIHDVLVDVGNEGADSIAARFVEECKLMSELRHPNVVQFLGLCISPSSPLPILVMEHLYCSLDDLLESTPAIPLYMKRSILRDVALGLAHLHGRNPAIIHRDLTARNVLLNNNMQAKLADFGVARILNLPVGKLEATLSRVPGTSTYMPPEVFNREAKYNSAVDIFSFGHLLLYTLIQKQPGVEAATYVDSSGGIVARTELERREDIVARLYGILGREHPFVEIVTECLQTNAALRPSILTVRMHYTHS